MYIVYHQPRRPKEDSSDLVYQITEWTTWGRIFHLKCCLFKKTIYAFLGTIVLKQTTSENANAMKIYFMDIMFILKEIMTNNSAFRDLISKRIFWASACLVLYKL